MSGTYVVDSGNVTRRVRTPWVIDSGNVARRVRKIYVIDSGGVARLVFFTAQNFSMTAGSSGSLSGYDHGIFGTLSPTLLPDGNTIFSIFRTSPSPFPLDLYITGFSSNPGSHYLTSLFINSTTFLATSATYSYAAGAANWHWATGTNFISGNFYSGVITL